MLRPFEFDGAMAKQIAQHPNTETITDILRGEKFTSGIMPHSSRDSATYSEPQFIHDLNNFHGYFQGGVYRGAGLFELSSAAKSQSHLRTLLQVLARDMSQGHVDLIASLAASSGAGQLSGVRPATSPHSSRFKRYHAQTKDAS